MWVSYKYWALEPLVSECRLEKLPSSPLALWPPESTHRTWTELPKFSVLQTQPRSLHRGRRRRSITIQDSRRTENQICERSNLAWILFWIPSSRQNKNAHKVNWRNNWLHRAGPNSKKQQKKAEALLVSELPSWPSNLSSRAGTQRAIAFRVNNPIWPDSCLVSIRDEFRPLQMSCGGKGKSAQSPDDLVVLKK